MVATAFAATAAALRCSPASWLGPHRPRQSLLLPHLSMISSGQCESHQSTHLCSHRKAKICVLRIKVKSEDEMDDEACELVNGVELLIGESGDRIRAHLFTAVKNNNGIGLLLLSDMFGFEDSSTRDFAYRMACNGYNVLVPDLFRGDPWKNGQPASEYNHWLARHQTERVAKDIELSKEWLINEFSAAGISKKIGAIGFGVGGKHLIETLAKDDNSNYGAGVCFYGAGINTSFAEDIVVPILFICGDSDSLCPAALVLDLEKRISGSKAVIYNDRGHGFAHRPESVEEDRDAEDAFNVLRNWLKDCLVFEEDKAVVSN